MILKQSRLYSATFMAVGLALVIPLGAALANHALDSRYAWLAWTNFNPKYCLVVWGFAVAALLCLINGIRHFATPPVLLEIKPDGIDIHYKFDRSFTRNADLLPWRIVEKMQMYRVHGKDNSFKWAIELTLSASPPFDAARRSALYLSDNDRLFYINVSVLDHPGEVVLAAMDSAWRCRNNPHQ